MAKVALLIGVSDYETSFAALPAATRDVEAMKEVLENPEMGGFDHVKILINPNASEMLEEIENYFRDRQPEDLILFFFSGHGVKDEKRDLFFSARNTDKQKGELARAKAVSANFVRETIQWSKAKRKVIILDCCFSGAFGDFVGKDDGSVDIETQLGAEGVVVLTSSSSTQYSFEQKESGMLSLYTRYLVEGMKTGAADENSDGFISVDELHQYASRKVHKAAPAMNPKIIVLKDEGFKIQLAKAPIGDPGLRYRKEAERLVKNGKFSITAQRLLNLLKKELNLSSEQTSAIENEVIQPHQVYQDKLQEYTEALDEAAEAEYPLSQDSLNNLKDYQKRLGLKDEDINKLIEGRVLPPKSKTRKSIPYQVKVPSHLTHLKLTIAQILSRQPKRILIFLSLAIISFLTVIGIWLLITRPPDKVAFPPPDKQPTSLQDRISFGDRILINKEEGNPAKPAFEDAKQKGAAAMGKGDYEQAVAEYTKAIQEYPNAPETLIYLNNARIGAKKSYVIAVSVPITSSDPGRASAMLRGFAQAQNKVNQAGGINGIGLKLKIFDDNDDKEVAKQVASAIVKDPEILAAMGHWSSGTSLATAPIYQSGKISFITSISTSIELEKFVPYVFRTNTTTRMGGKALAGYALTKLNTKNIAIFYDSTSDYSKALEFQFSSTIRQGGGDIVSGFDLADPMLKIADSIKQAKEQGAEAILLIPAPNSVNTALQVVTSNRRQLPLLGDMANLYVTETLKVGENAVGMVMAPSWHINGDPNSDFSRQAIELWKAEVNYATAMSYNAAQAIIEALKRQTNPSREGIQKALTAPGFSVNGVSGKFRFSSGDADTPVQFVEVRAVTSSSTGYAFVPVQLQ